MRTNITNISKENLDIIFDNDINTEAKIFSENIIHGESNSYNYYKSYTFMFERIHFVESMNFRVYKKTTDGGNGLNTMYTYLYLIDIDNKKYSIVYLSDISKYTDKIITGIEFVINGGSGYKPGGIVELYISDLKLRSIIPIPNDINEIQLLSKEYNQENILRKDYIGNLEDCNLTTIEILQNVDKVTNNQIKAINIKTISDDEFILE